MDPLRCQVPHERDVGFDLCGNQNFTARSNHRVVLHRQFRWRSHRSTATSCLSEERDDFRTGEASRIPRRYQTPRAWHRQNVPQLFSEGSRPQLHGRASDGMERASCAHLCINPKAPADDGGISRRVAGEARPADPPPPEQRRDDLGFPSGGYEATHTNLRAGSPATDSMLLAELSAYLPSSPQSLIVWMSIFFVAMCSQAPSLVPSSRKTRRHIVNNGRFTRHGEQVENPLGPVFARSSRAFLSALPRCSGQYPWGTYSISAVFVFAFPKTLETTKTAPRASVHDPGLPRIEHRGRAAIARRRPRVQHRGAHGMNGLARS